MVIQLSESHTSNLLGNGNKASVYIKLTKKIVTAKISGTTSPTSKVQ